VKSKTREEEEGEEEEEEEESYRLAPISNEKSRVVFTMGHFFLK